MLGGRKKQQTILMHCKKQFVNTYRFLVRTSLDQLLIAEVKVNKNGIDSSIVVFPKT